MDNQTFSKIWIVIIALLFIAGGILAWQYFGAPKEEAKIPVVKQFGGVALLIEECGDRNYVANTANYIIEGIVEKAESRWNKEKTNIFTYTDFRIEKYVKGTPFKKDKLQIITEGGTVGEITQWVEDQPIFHKGKKARIYFEERNGEFLIVCGHFGVEEIAEDETANWKTYKNEEYGYEIKHPPNWYFYDKGVFYGTDLENCVGEYTNPQTRVLFSPEKIENCVPPLTHGWFWFSIEIKTKYTSTLEKTGITKSEGIYDTECGREVDTTRYEPITFNNLPANKITQLASTALGDKPRTRIIFNHNDYGFEIIFVNDCEGNSIDHNFEKMLSTFRFLEGKPSGEKPYIQVLSPNGGEKWEIGKTYKIQWQSSGVDAVYARITHRDDPMGIEVISGVSGDLGTYSWTISPSLFSPRDDYKITIFGKGGFPSDTSDNYFSIVAPTTTPTYRTTIFLFKDLKTCIVGDKCISGNCKKLYKDGNTFMEFEDNSNFRSLKPSDPEPKNYQLKKCLETKLDNEEINYLKGEISKFVDKVSQWSKNAINLSVEYVEIPSIEIAMSRWGDGFWLAPGDIKSLVAQYITKDTDFVLVTNDIYDERDGVHWGIGGCEGAFGADYGLGGAGYSWIPKTNPGFWFECAGEKAYIHGWLHQLDYALEQITGVKDIYTTTGKSCQEAFPKSLCGNATSNTYAWFPNPDCAAYNPDYPSCKYENYDDFCKSIQPKDCDFEWDEHLLSVHYDPKTNLIGNHCRNGKQDFDETGIDSGGKCTH